MLNFISFCPFDRFSCLFTLPPVPWGFPPALGSSTCPKDTQTDSLSRWFAVLWKRSVTENNYTLFWFLFTCSRFSCDNNRNCCMWIISWELVVCYHCKVPISSLGFACSLDCLFVVLVVPWQPIADGKNSKLTSYLTYFLKESKSFMVKSSFFAPSVLISIWLSLNACRYHKRSLVLSSIATTWRGKQRNNAFSFIQFTYQKMVICVALPILADLLPSITNIDTCNKKV